MRHSLLFLVVCILNLPLFHSTFGTHAHFRYRSDLHCCFESHFWVLGRLRLCSAREMTTWTCSHYPGKHHRMEDERCCRLLPAVAAWLMCHLCTASIPLASANKYYARIRGANHSNRQQIVAQDFEGAMALWPSRQAESGLCAVL
jgi:hypothetical protein